MKKKLAPVDKETVKKISRLVKETNSNSISIINAAIRILERAIGRQIVLRQDGSEWELKINRFKKYKEITSLIADN